MAMSETVSAIFGAIAAAQGDMEQPNKDREVEVQMKKPDGTNGGKYKFKYATLDNIIATVRPALVKHGLGFVQFVGEGQMMTRLVHTSGEFLDAGIPMPNLPAKPQEAGAVVSYFKRYSLCAALGIVADEDDEKNVAIEHDATPGPAWPEGPYTSKSGLKSAWKALVHDLHGAGSLEAVEDIIDRDKEMLAQFRAAARNGVDDLRAQYQGQGDFIGVADELRRARDRFAGTQGVPREPGPPAGFEDSDREPPETIVRLLITLNECQTMAAVKAWHNVNKPLIDAADDDHRATLRAAYAARGKAMTANTTAAG